MAKVILPDTEPLYINGVQHCAHCGNEPGGKQKYFRKNFCDTCYQYARENPGQMRPVNPACRICGLPVREQRQMGFRLHKVCTKARRHISQTMPIELRDEWESKVLERISNFKPEEINEVLIRATGYVIRDEMIGKPTPLPRYRVISLEEHMANKRVEELKFKDVLARAPEDYRLSIFLSKFPGVGKTSREFLKETKNYDFVENRATGYFEMVA